MYREFVLISLQYEKRKGLIWPNYLHILLQWFLKEGKTVFNKYSQTWLTSLQGVRKKEKKNVYVQPKWEGSNNVLKMEWETTTINYFEGIYHKSHTKLFFLIESCQK